MKLWSATIDGPAVAESPVAADHRGSFSRLFCRRELASVLAGRHIVQSNFSVTRTVGAVRGLHYQKPPHAEMKLVRCLRGSVFDVAVDLRRGSPTFLKWHGEELTRENARMMIIPEGFAHGFQVLDPDSEMLYLHTAFYEKSAEGGVRHDDPLIGISWPLAVTELSDRDRCFPLLSERFSGIAL